MTDTTTKENNILGDMISSYTSEEAEEDGFLINVSKFCNLCCLRINKNA